MRLAADFGGMGTGAMALAAAAVATIATGLWFVPGSGVPLLALWGLSIALVACLCRVAMPVPLRIGLIAALLGTAFGITSTADPVHATAATKRIDRELAEAAAARERAAAMANGPASAVRGARIALTGGDWGRRIDGALDGTIGGAGAASLSIVGTATVQSPAEGTRVAIVWSIGGDGRRAECGTTTISGRDTGTLLAAARDSFSRGVTASLAGAGAQCG